MKMKNKNVFIFLMCFITLLTSNIVWSQRTEPEWIYETGGTVWSVAISDDGNYIAAGAWDNNVYFLDREGNLLWKNEVSDKVWCLALSGDGNYVAVGCKDKKFYLFNGDGELLWNYETGGIVTAIDLSADGSLIAAGSRDDKIYLLDRDGNVIATYEADNDINAIRVTSDGEKIVAGSRDKSVYYLNREGELLWSYETDESVYSIDITPNGDYVVAATKSNTIYLLNGEGELLWSTAVEEHGGELKVRISRDGELVAGFNVVKVPHSDFISGSVILVNKEGEEEWRYRVINNKFLDGDISADGTLIIGASRNGTIYLLSNERELVWCYQVEGQAGTVAMTPDGELIVVGTNEDKVYLFSSGVVIQETKTKETKTEETSAGGIPIEYIVGIIILLIIIVYVVLKSRKPKKKKRRYSERSQ